MSITEPPKTDVTGVHLCTYLLDSLLPSYLLYLYSNHPSSADDFCSVFITCLRV